MNKTSIIILINNTWADPKISFTVPAKVLAIDLGLIVLLMLIISSKVTFPLCLTVKWYILVQKIIIMKINKINMWERLMYESAKPDNDTQ